MIDRVLLVMAALAFLALGFGILRQRSELLRAIREFRRESSDFEDPWG